jgi:hypothetical protein
MKIFSRVFNYIIFFILLIFLFTSLKTIDISSIEPKKEFIIKTFDIEKEYYNFFCYYTKSPRITKLIMKYAKENDVEYSLAFALPKVESGFLVYALNYNKLSKSYDVGIFELNTKSYTKYSIKQLYNPELNIKLGLEHLRWSLNKANNNVIKALSFYNAGYWKTTNYMVGTSTLDYINKIMLEKEIIESELIKRNFLASN